MKIGIGSDHGGVNLKAYIKEHLREIGHEVIDYGTQAEVPADYPDVAEKLCRAYLSGEFDRGILVCSIADGTNDRGILICRSGIGMSIAANKIDGIRAAHVTDCYSARMCRQHNDAQILCLGERVTGQDLALEIVDAYLLAKHLGGRHTRRVDKIMKLENTEK